MVTSRIGDNLALDVEEDISTRWVPDVLNNFDLSECLKTASLTAGDVQFIDIPKSHDGWRTAPVLNAQALRALRDAVSPLREISDSLLDPAVCGYRSGSTRGNSYGTEYRRFRDIGSALASEHRYVAVADVRDFFGSVDVAAVEPTMSALLQDVWWPIQTFLVAANDVGIRGLPAGYGDARLVANHLLREPDAAIGAPFTRWVDDYRIFADTPAAARRAVGRLADALGHLGLCLNNDKCEVIASRDYLARRHGAPLESVYHPDLESREAVRASLRTVFLRAVNENNRRLLRFSLPRLGEQKDAIAVEYAIGEIERNSVDTPRLAFYLSAFLDDGEVAERISHLAKSPGLSPWATTRLCPLLCSISLCDATFDALGHAIRATDQPALWAALLRVLAVHGQKELVVDEVTTRQSLDPRAAIGAYLDIGRPIPSDLRLMAPCTVEAADEAVNVPLPTAYTLL